MILTKHYISSWLSIDQRVYCVGPLATRREGDTLLSPTHGRQSICDVTILTVSSVGVIRDGLSTWLFRRTIYRILSARGRLEATLKSIAARVQNGAEKRLRIQKGLEDSA